MSVEIECHINLTIADGCFDLVTNAEKPWPRATETDRTKFMEYCATMKDNTLRHVTYVNGNSTYYVFATNDRCLVNMFSSYGGRARELPFFITDSLFALKKTEASDQPLLAFGARDFYVKEPAKNSNGAGWLLNPLTSDWYYLIFVVDEVPKEDDAFEEFAAAITARTIREIKYGYLYLMKKFNLEQLNAPARGMGESLQYWAGRSRHEKMYSIPKANPINTAAFSDMDCIIVRRGWNYRSNMLDYVVVVDIFDGEMYIVARNEAAAEILDTKFINAKLYEAYRRYANVVPWYLKKHVMYRMPNYRFAVAKERADLMVFDGALAMDNKMLVQVDDKIKQFGIIMERQHKTLEELTREVSGLSFQLRKLLDEIDDIEVERHQDRVKECM